MRVAVRELVASDRHVLAFVPAAVMKVPRFQGVAVVFRMFCGRFMSVQGVSEECCERGV